MIIFLKIYVKITLFAKPIKQLSLMSTNEFLNSLYSKGSFYSCKSAYNFKLTFSNSTKNFCILC